VKIVTVGVAFLVAVLGGLLGIVAGVGVTYALLVWGGGEQADTLGGSRAWSRPGPLEIGSGNLTDVVVGGTGIFEGATGTLTGTVRLEGSNARPSGTSTVKLSGTIHFDP
jgi:hypothetical protein